MTQTEKLQRLPWQPYTDAAGMEGQGRSALPMDSPVTEETGADTKLIVARGIAAENSEYMAMGPSLGCCGCVSIVRGDATRKPRSPECRARVMWRLKRHDGHDVQARLAAAQLR